VIRKKKSLGSEKENGEYIGEKGKGWGVDGRQRLGEAILSGRCGEKKEEKKSANTLGTEEGDSVKPKYVGKMGRNGGKMKG